MFKEIFFGKINSFFCYFCKYFFNKRIFFLNCIHRFFLDFISFRSCFQVKLIGHSLGGAISFLYAASYPDEVEYLISLDIASPSVRDITKSVEITGTYIDRFLKYEDLTLDSVPCYNYKEMIDIVETAYNGDITRESAEILMKRGMQPAPIMNQYYFRRDPRLKVNFCRQFFFSSFSFRIFIFLYLIIVSLFYQFLIFFFFLFCFLSKGSFVNIILISVFNNYFCIFLKFSIFQHFYY